MKKPQPEQQGMDFLQSLPRRWITVYIPLAIFVFVLLFPFYWMVITAFKSDAELALHTSNPFWVVAPTLSHFKRLLFHTPFTGWMINTIIISTAATFISLAASVFGAYAIERLRFRGSKQVGLGIFFAYLVPHPFCSFRLHPLCSSWVCLIHAGL